MMAHRSGTYSVAGQTRDYQAIFGPFDPERHPGHSPRVGRLSGPRELVWCRLGLGNYIAPARLIPDARAHLQRV
jgi:hypothetical protein